MNIVVIALLVFLSAPVWGQRPGTLSGRVASSNGRELGNTTIIITNESGMAQRVVTGADGSFTVDLAPGTYDIEVDMNGMRRRGRERVTISSTAASEVSLTLDEQNSGTQNTGSVEIRATASTLQTDSAEVSRGYGTRTVRSLPLLDRQHQELTGLMPGVTPPEVANDPILDPQRARYFSVNGQPSYANVHQQDGALHTELVTGQVVRVPSNEAVEQFNIRTSNYNAEYGFSGGSWTNTVTRPGTNQFHGSLFEFNTNSFFTARNPLTSSDGQQPRFNQNQFGGTAGGPIIPDRMFIFGSYEGLLRRGNELRFATVPTSDFLAGNFGGTGATIYNPLSGNANTGVGRTPFPNNQTPASQISPFAQALLGYLPAANQSGLVNNLVGSSPLVNDYHRMDGKLDYRFSDRITGFVRYGFTHGDTDRGSLLGPLGDAASSQLRNHTAVASASVNWSNALLSEFRFGFGRYRNLILPTADNTQFGNALSSFGFNNGLPNINIAGFSPFGLPGNYPSKPVNNTYNPATNWIAHTGMHRLKFGGEVRHIQASGFDPGFFSPRGSFLFGSGATALPGGSATLGNSQANAFAAFLTGSPSQAGISSFLSTPTLRQTQTAAYITDTINLWSRLYLELGVRYDVYSPIRPRNDAGGSVFDPVTNLVANGRTGANDLDNYDWNNVAPRIGFAFQPFSKMVVRGGYGIHYFPTPFAFAGINQAALGTQAGLTGGFGSVPFRNPTVNAAGNGTGSTTAGNQPFFVNESGSNRTPYVQTYSFMVQGDLTRGFLFDVGYVGTNGRQLPYLQQLNVSQPGFGAAGLPFAQFGRTAGTTLTGLGLTNNYNSLQVNLTKRFSGGLAFTGAYTFSKALDYGTSLLNPFNRQGNYGPADTDRAHILSLSHVWMLPFGAGSYYFKEGVAAQILGNWEINGIMNWATGTPYTVTVDPLLCNCPGLNAVSANFNGSGAFNGSSSFDPTQFSSASAGFGSLGRNALRGPDLFNYNLSLFRNFPVRENIKLELRGEVYNLTNSTNYANPVANALNAGFGRSVSTFNGLGGRQFQVGGRLLF